MTNLSQLEDQIQLSLDLIEKPYYLIDFTDRNTYGNWLAQTYYYVSQVTRVTALAAARCDLAKDELIHRRLIEMLNAEKGHEIFALEDLNNLGFKLSDFPESMATRNFFQILIYMIETYGPYALVGYFIPQEGLACEKLPPIYDLLTKKFGEKTTEFLRIHCKLDVTHHAENLEFLRNCNDDQLNIIRHGVLRSTELYLELLKSIQTIETGFNVGFLDKKVIINSQANQNIL